jgi:hypothetical protein
MQDWEAHKPNVITQNQDMYYGIISYNLIEIQSQLDRNSNIL